MSKKEIINYQTVAEVCGELLKLEEKPSVRKVHKRLGGGSFSTISEHLQHWQAQQALAKSIDADISDTFKQAILAEFGRVTKNMKEKLQAALSDKDAQLNEAQELLSEYEGNIEKLKLAFEASKDAARQEQLRLEKRLSAVEARIQESEKREAMLFQQLEQVREGKHQAELKTAIAETKVTGLEKQHELLESKADAQTQAKSG